MAKEFKEEDDDSVSGEDPSELDEDSDEDGNEKKDEDLDVEY